jgi:tetratricopeptide (TPR) repeat protein
MMSMKNISRLILILIFPALLASCDALLNVESERYVFEEEHRMGSANDTLYSMFGVLTQLQKLADSYVILGELRGDLMDVDEASNRFLKEVNNFSFSQDNPYSNNIRDYYAVINNCNYIIHNIDTSVVKGGVKVMYRNMAAAKAVRAWTYMQAILNFGKVTYYEKPIITLDDALKTYPEYTDVKELAALLINDLKPWKDAGTPNFGSLGTFNSRLAFFPVRFLLGDLYLWRGEYEQAANEYRDMMFFNRVLLTTAYRSTLQVVNDAFTGNATVNWVNVFSFGSNEQITNLLSSNQYQLVFTVDSLAEIRQIVPSTVAVNNWITQRYIHSATLDTLIDMRWYGSISRAYRVNNNMEFELTNNYSIEKFARLNDDQSLTKQVLLYRAGLLYLRYAEAVNRMGKPNFALAVLKNGLRGSTINSNLLVPPAEKDSIIPNYMNFSDERFANNIGVRARGCGNVNLDTVHFVIPKNMFDKDSIINYVEDLIINEAALETAFEGNRFHDLMRVAMRRNDNAYLADKVAAKHSNNKEAIRTKLMDRKNWYLR